LKSTDQQVGWEQYRWWWHRRYRSRPAPHGSYHSRSPRSYDHECRTVAPPTSINQSIKSNLYSASYKYWTEAL